MVLLAAGGIFVGAFLPWASVGAFTIAGTTGDGVLTLILGAAIGLLAWARRANVVILVLLLVACLISGYDIINIGTAFASDQAIFPVRVGGGLILTALAAVVGVGAWIADLTARSA